MIQIVAFSRFLVIFIKEIKTMYKEIKTIITEEDSMAAWTPEGIAKANRKNSTLKKGVRSGRRISNHEIKNAHLLSNLQKEACMSSTCMAEQKTVVLAGVAVTIEIKHRDGKVFAMITTPNEDGTANNIQFDGEFDRS